jgi:hypothetical protein
VRQRLCDPAYVPPEEHAYWATVGSGDPRF